MQSFIGKERISHASEAVVQGSTIGKRNYDQPVLHNFCLIVRSKRQQRFVSGKRTDD
jgi:hypothetical protein